jgi:hypothetical protein
MIVFLVDYKNIAEDKDGCYPACSVTNPTDCGACARRLRISWTCPGCSTSRATYGNLFDEYACPNCEECTLRATLLSRLTYAGVVERTYYHNEED